MIADQQAATPECVKIVGEELMLTYCCLVASLAQGHGRNLAVCDRGQRCPCPGRPLGSGWGTCSGLSRMPEREWTRAEGSCSQAACGLGGRWASSQWVKGAGSWLGRSSRQRVPAGVRSGRCPAGAVLRACGQGLLWSHCPLGQTKGCRLFMELGLTPGAASGPGRRPAHLAAGCPLPAQPLHPTSWRHFPAPGPSTPGPSCLRDCPSPGPGPYPADGKPFFSGSVHSGFPMKPGWNAPVSCTVHRQPACFRVFVSFPSCWLCPCSPVSPTT